MTYSDQSDGGRLAGVTSVLLERETKHGNLLIRDRVKQGVDDTLDEAALLVLVHDDDLMPIRCDLGQVEGLGQVRQIENVFLEAGAAEADRSLKELGTDASVATDSVGNLVNVGTGSLADGGQSVDGRDTLGKKSVGGLI